MYLFERRFASDTFLRARPTATRDPAMKRTFETRLCTWPFFIFVCMSEFPFANSCIPLRIRLRRRLPLPGTAGIAPAPLPIGGASVAGATVSRASEGSEAPNAIPHRHELSSLTWSTASKCTSQFLCMVLYSYARHVEPTRSHSILHCSSVAMFSILRRLVPSSSPAPTRQQPFWRLYTRLFPVLGVGRTTFLRVGKGPGAGVARVVARDDAVTRTTPRRVVAVSAGCSVVVVVRLAVWGTTARRVVATIGARVLRAVAVTCGVGRLRVVAVGVSTR